MKKMIYKIIAYKGVYNQETEQEEKQEALVTIKETYSVEAEAHAREVAVGEVEIYDDGIPAPVCEPSTDEILDAMLGVE